MRSRLTCWRRPRILCWWGIWTLSIAPSLHGAGSASTRSAQLGTLVSPLFTMMYVPLSLPAFRCLLGLPDPSLLLFGSGVPTAEKPAAQKFHKMSYPDGAAQDPAPENAAWANYQAYRAQTSILLPLPPVVYRALPQWVKRTVLLDLPMYEWTP